MLQLASIIIPTIHLHVHDPKHLALLLVFNNIEAPHTARMSVHFVSYSMETITDHNNYFHYHYLSADYWLFNSLLIILNVKNSEKKCRSRSPTAQGDISMSDDVMAAKPHI